MSKDPIGFIGGISHFTYIQNNPARYIDPTGLEKADFQEKVGAVLACGIPAALAAKKDEEVARKAAALTVRNSELTGILNGPADAYRHCLWSCLMTKSTGFSCAKVIGDNHEAAGNRAEPPQPKTQEQMDLANNRVGRQCGLQKDNKPCTQKCMEKAKNGGLFGLGGVPFPL